MDSPLAPVVANIFMGFYESNWLNEYNLNKPNFYLRYDDDILAAFDNEQDSLNFLEFLNKRHPNIKLTIKKKNHSIAFLDFFISDINNQNLTLQDTSDIHYLKLSYFATCQIILKINLQNFAKIFVKKMLTLG